MAQAAHGSPRMQRMANLAKTLKGLPHKADGGPVATNAEMTRAKRYISGMNAMAPSDYTTFSGKSAFHSAAAGAKAAADRMRPATPDDEKD